MNIWKGHRLVMKKILALLLIAIIFVIPFSFTDSNDKQKHVEIPTNETILVEKIYNNWDEAKYAGEYLKDEALGYVKFRSASRIENTEKFRVIYASVTANIHKND